MLTITVESQEKTLLSSLAEAAARGEVPEKLESDQVSADSQINHDQKTQKHQEGKYFSYQVLLFLRKRVNNRQLHTS